MHIIFVYHINQIYNFIGYVLLYNLILSSAKLSSICLERKGNSPNFYPLFFYLYIIISFFFIKVVNILSKHLFHLFINS